MLFFERELRRIFDGRGLDTTYIGRSCYITANEIKIKAEFSDLGHMDHFMALKLTAFMPDKGVSDQLVLRFSDYFSSDDRNIVPYIWVCDGKPDWYVHPKLIEHQNLAEDAAAYVGLYQIQESSATLNM